MSITTPLRNAPRCIGLIAHPGKAGAARLVAAIHRELLLYKVFVKMEKTTAALAGEENANSVADLGHDCDLLIVLGGDGTILNTVHALGANLKPIFGINLGLLGFLTCLGSADYKQAVRYAVTGDYQLSQRTLLAVDVLRNNQTRERAPTISDLSSQTHCGLNDAVISRGALSRLVRLEVRVSSELLTEYNADGLIIATPTGSTAYSLSAGGPLLAPDSGVFAITPICPHTLTNRSVIVHDHATIEVSSRNQKEELFLTVDGQRNIALNSTDVVLVRRAAQTLSLAMLTDLTFFELARRKLKWNGASSA